MVSKVRGVPVAWTKYPAPYRSVPDPPGKGGPVTTFQILFGAPPPPLAQNPWLQEFNKRLNVQWQATLADSPDYTDKLNTLASSGSFPDITYINFNPDGVYGGAAFEKFVQEGAFHDLTDMLTGSSLKQWPNLTLLPEQTWKGSSFEGRLYGVPYPIQIVNAQLQLIRQDWAEKLGVANPKNANEVMKMFVAFSKGHPNGRSSTKKTWGLSLPYANVWQAMYRVPNNWRLNSDGSLTKDLETEEYKQALDFAAQLWRKGAFEPEALTNTSNDETSFFEGGQVGILGGGGTEQFGDQPNTETTVTKENDPSANPQPWSPPGADGGKALFPQTSGNYGFGAIPTTIKSEARVMELIGLMNWCAAPFGSEEFIFYYDGIPGQMYNEEGGEPVAVSNGNQDWSSGLNYLCGTTEVNYYFSHQPNEATLIQKFQEQQLQQSVADPTVNLYSPTWVQQAGNLIQVQQNGYNDIFVGRKPLSSLNDLISSWKSQGGDQVRKEFEQSLKRCG
ncbi:MAG TPA: extracellular solute-binding protein [Candidatus Dormibacteraeota bacterium]|nr:extracellular solute-binding protein [Candidatus Dormibacteraeota bacterium]